MKIHPRGDLIQLLIERLSGDQRELLRHALQCAPCRERLLGSFPGGSATLWGRLLPWRFSEHEYSRVIEGVLEKFRPRFRAVERESAAAPGLLAELLRHPPERREVLIRNSERFRSLSLCDQLLRASLQECFKDPRAGEALARLALGLLDLLDPEVCGALVLEDARARCWATVANAQRVASDLRGAEEAFARAEKHLRAGTRDRLERARLLHYLGVLRRAQRRFPESIALLRRAVRIFLRAGETQPAAEATVGLAIARYEAGERAAGIELLREAERLVDPGELRLAFSICHNLVFWLAESGRILEAQVLLPKSRALSSHLQDPLLRLRLSWIEGRIAHRQGRLEEAAELFDRVRQGFLERGIGYDAALASLDLAIACAQLGRTAEVKRLAGEMLPIFQSRDVHREAIAALIVFQRAASSETVNLGLLEEISAYLQRAAKDPSLRFEPKGAAQG